MSSKMTIEVEASRYRVNFGMLVHPITGEICFGGDVISVPDQTVDRLVADGLLTRVPDDVPENRIQRGEPSQIVGVNISQGQYELQQLREAVGSLPGGELAAYAKANLDQSTARA